MAVHHPPLLQIPLGILLCLPERRRRFHLGRNRLAERARPIQLIDLRLRLLHLLVRSRKHHAPVLRAPVRPLPVHLGRIVQREKRIQQRVIAHSRRIERYVHYLRMSRAVRTHLFIRRMFEFASFISCRCVEYPRHLCKSGFYAPKTSSSKCCFLNCHFVLLLCCPLGRVRRSHFALLVCRTPLGVKTVPLLLQVLPGFAPEISCRLLVLFGCIRPGFVLHRRIKIRRYF